MANSILFQSIAMSVPFFVALLNKFILKVGDQSDNNVLSGKSRQVTVRSDGGLVCWVFNDTYWNQRGRATSVRSFGFAG